MELETFSVEELTVLVNRGITPAYVEAGGTLILNQKCVRDGSVVLDEARRTDPKRKRIPAEKLLRLYDVLVNSTGQGTLGRVAQVVGLAEEGTVDSHITIVRPDADKVDPRFFGFAMRSMQAEIEGMAEGSTGQTELSRDNLKTLDLALPARSEQEAIGILLSGLDEKIQLNRAMSAAIEKLTRALFAQWFDTEVRGQGSSLGDEVEVAKGLSYKGEGLADSGMPMHNLNAVYEFGGYKYDGIKWYTGAYRDRHLCLPGDVIVANTEQGFDYLLIGSPAIVPTRFGESGLFTHHIYRVRPKKSSFLTNHFLYLLIAHPLIRAQVHEYTNGTTVNSLDQEGLQRPCFTLPSKEKVDRFSRLVAPLFAQQEVVQDENVTLAALRDTLLPKLMRGEVRVKTGLKETTA